MQRAELAALLDLVDREITARGDENVVECLRLRWRVEDRLDVVIDDPPRVEQRLRIASERAVPGDLGRHDYFV